MYQTIRARRLYGYSTERYGRHFKRLLATGVDVRRQFHVVNDLPNLSQLVLSWDVAKDLLPEWAEAARKRRGSGRSRYYSAHDYDESSSTQDTINATWKGLAQRITHLELQGFAQADVAEVFVQFPVVTSFKADSWNWAIAEQTMAHLFQLVELSLPVLGRFDRTSWASLEGIVNAGKLESLEIHFIRRNEEVHVDGDGYHSDDSSWYDHSDADDEREEVADPPAFSAPFLTLKKLSLWGTPQAIFSVFPHLSHSPLTDLTIVFSRLDTFDEASFDSLRTVFDIPTLHHLAIRYEVSNGLGGREGHNPWDTFSPDFSSTLRELAAAHPSIRHFDDEALVPLDPFEQNGPSLDDSQEAFEKLVEWAQQRMKRCVAEEDEAGVAEVLEAMDGLYALQLSERD